MIDQKAQVIQQLSEMYRRWNELLDGLDEEVIVRPRLPGKRSIKDEVAHLWAWQQRSIARMEAGLHNREPVFPPWPETVDPAEEEPVDEINEWIYAANQTRPWEHVYAGWQAGFTRLIELGQAASETELFEVGRYAWMPDYPLSAVLTGSSEHHAEHLDQLLEWLGNKSALDS